MPLGIYAWFFLSMRMRVDPRKRGTVMDLHLASQGSYTEKAGHRFGGAEAPRNAQAHRHQ